MRPIGDRLFYINADKHLHFKINSSTAFYKSGQEVELAISISDDLNNPVEGIFSIAVVDSLSGYNAEIFTPNIDNSFNYYPELSNNLPPKVLAYGIENLTEEERDLIFMVYGWSRYKWEFSGYQNPIKELVNYDFIKINIPSVQTKKISVNKLDLVALEDLRVIHLSADDSDEIWLPLDSLPDMTRTVTLIPDSKNKKVLNNVTLSIPFKGEYFISNKLHTPQQTISINEYPPSSVSGYFSIAKDVIEIPEVTIIGHPLPEKKYQNIYEERYKYANVKSSDPELIRRTIFLETAIRTLASPTLITDDGVFFRGGKSFFGGVVGALIVLDGMPIYSQGWQIAKSIPMNEIASITILKGNQGRTIYGLEASGGVIFIETMFHDPTLANFRTDWRSENKNSDLLLPINIYRTNKEFYIPSKFVVENDPVFQNRSTIFWDPEIYVDSKTPVIIKYTNLKDPGTVVVTVNGVSTNNQVGTGGARYIVK
jgi:TonB-dependent Receptor Plug Domain